MIVFDGKGGELEEAKEELMKSNWETGPDSIGGTKMKFLHTPKAEILESSRKVLATSLAGASEIGNATTIGNASDLPPEDEIKNVISIGIQKENKIEDILKEIASLKNAFWEKTHGESK